MTIEDVVASIDEQALSPVARAEKLIEAVGGDELREWGRFKAASVPPWVMLAVGLAGYHSNPTAADARALLVQLGAVDPEEADRWFWSECVPRMRRGRPCSVEATAYCQHVLPGLPEPVLDKTLTQFDALLVRQHFTSPDILGYLRRTVASALAQRRNWGRLARRLLEHGGEFPRDSESVALWLIAARNYASPDDSREVAERALAEALRRKAMHASLTDDWKEYRPTVDSFLWDHTTSLARRLATVTGEGDAELLLEALRAFLARDSRAELEPKDYLSAMREAYRLEENMNRLVNEAKLTECKTHLSSLPVFTVFTEDIASGLTDWIEELRRLSLVAALREADARSRSLVHLLAEVPADTRLVVIVEGYLDKEYLAVAAERLSMPLDGTYVHPAGGAGKAAKAFVELHSAFAASRAVIALFDADTEGRRAADALHVLKFQKKRDFFLLSDWREPDPAVQQVEAEDMFPATLVESVVGEGGRAFWNEARTRKGGGTRYALTDAGKAGLLEWIKKRGSVDDMEGWRAVLAAFRQVVEDAARRRSRTK